MDFLEIDFTNTRSSIANHNHSLTTFISLVRAIIIQNLVPICVSTDITSVNTNSG